MMAVLITGASSGIGKEFSLLFARHKHNLVLVARSSGTLALLKEHIEKNFGVDVLTLAKDLSDPYAPQEIFDELKKLNIEINILINNAGFGSSGWFYESDLINNHDMVQVNVDALTQLTRLFLPSMIERKSGKILNVASTAAFQPGPLMAVYYASKAYVLSFSEALAEELNGTGVTVTALCPGPTQTHFQATANIQEAKLFKGKKLPTAKVVAEYGYKELMKGKNIAIPGLMNKAYAFSTRLIPRKTAARIVKGLHGK